LSTDFGYLRSQIENFKLLKISVSHIFSASKQHIKRNTKQTLNPERERDLVGGDRVEDIDLASKRESELASTVVALNPHIRRDSSGDSGMGVDGVGSDVLDDAADNGAGFVVEGVSFVANVRVVDGLDAGARDVVIVGGDLVGHVQGLGVTVHWE